PRKRVHVRGVVEAEHGGMRSRALDPHQRTRILLELADELLVVQLLHGHLRGDQATWTCTNQRAVEPNALAQICITPRPGFRGPNVSRVSSAIMRGGPRA